MGRRKKGRDIDGILLLDKPLGCSSNAALQRARRLFDARKAGHTGSLDPLASGLLPICFGEATKLSSWLLNAAKRYRVTAALGHETDTGDREGVATRKAEADNPSPQALAEIISQFVGEQKQIPPMYSALKRNGRPLYELARSGIEVEREARLITVFDLQVLHYSATGLTLDVAVSSGTYVRTLVEDIARKWGGAAHVSALRRTAVGGCDMTGMAGFEQLETQAACGSKAIDAMLVPPSRALPDWPAVMLDDEAAAAVSQGRAVELSEPHLVAGWVRIMKQAGGFMGLGEIDDAGILAPRRMFTRLLA